MCEAAEETNLHFFFQRGSSQQIWYELSLHFGFSHNVFVTVQDAFQWWCAQKYLGVLRLSSSYGAYGNG